MVEVGGFAAAFARGAEGKHSRALYCAERCRTALYCFVPHRLTCGPLLRCWSGACGVLVHTEEFTGSIPVSLTANVCSLWPVAWLSGNGPFALCPLYREHWGAGDGPAAGGAVRSASCRPWRAPPPSSLPRPGLVPDSWCPFASSPMATPCGWTASQSGKGSSRCRSRNSRRPAIRSTRPVAAVRSAPRRRRRCGRPPVGAENRATSRDLRVFVDQSIESITADDADVVGRWLARNRRQWCRVVQ